MKGTTVFIAGGTGFVGTGIIDALLVRGYHVRALVRPGSRLLRDGHELLQAIEGDPYDPKSYQEQMKGCAAAVNSIGIIREKKRKGVTFEKVHVTCNRRFMNAARAADVPRYILISALGARADGVSRYQTTKFRAEQELQSTGLAWTIFRPSLVIGPGAGFVKEIKPIVKAPVTPVFGDGRFTFTPVDRRVLGLAVTTAVDHPAARGIFELYSDQIWTYEEILRAMGKTLGTKVRALHVPLWLAGTMIAATGWLPFAPITMDQFRMLLEGSAASGRNAVSELGLEWIPLSRALEHALGKNK